MAKSVKDTTSSLLLELGIITLLSLSFLMSAYVMRWTFWSGIECSSTGIGVSWDSSICVEMCEISTGCSTGIGVSVAFEAFT